MTLGKNKSDTEDVGKIDVNLPFPGSTSSDLNRARSRHLAWIVKLGLWSSPAVEAAYKAADFPLFVAHTYPFAHGSDLDLVTDFTGWLWLLDDFFDKPGVRQASLEKTAAAIDNFRGVLYGLPVRTTDDPETPMVIAWRQLLDRVHERMSKSWCQQHHAHWEELFEAFQLEAENNSRGIIPEFNNYVQLRRAAGGAELAMDWIEVVGHFELPARIHTNPAFLSLRRNLLDIVGMTNDLFSARNEWNSGNTDNIVHVLAQRKQCPWSYANELTHNIISDTVARFQVNETEFYNSATYTALGPQDQANTRRFIEGMKYWMRGSLDWHYITPRYR